MASPQLIKADAQGLKFSVGSLEPAAKKRLVLLVKIGEKLHKSIPVEVKADGRRV